MPAAPSDTISGKTSGQPGTSTSAASGTMSTSARALTVSYAHILPFCRVTYVDIRPLSNSVEGLTFRQGSLLSLPFPAASIDSLSCLHVLEHVGLWRDGDPVEPQAYRRAAAELSRVLAPGGQLLMGTPVGRQRLCFDSHRIFDPQTIRDAFPTLHLAQFSLIDDVGHTVHTHASFRTSPRLQLWLWLVRLRAASQPIVLLPSRVEA